MLSGGLLIATASREQHLLLYRKPQARYILRSGRWYIRNPRRVRVTRVSGRTVPAATTIIDINTQGGVTPPNASLTIAYSELFDQVPPQAVDIAIVFSANEPAAVAIHIFRQIWPGLLIELAYDWVWELDFTVDDAVVGWIGELRLIAIIIELLILLIYFDN